MTQDEGISSCGKVVASRKADQWPLGAVRSFSLGALQGRSIPVRVFFQSKRSTGYSTIIYPIPYSLSEPASDGVAAKLEEQPIGGQTDRPLEQE